MADLMTGTYTFEALANKYGNFYAPAVRLYVNNRELDLDMTKKIASVDISLSLSSASAASIRLTGIYDSEKRSFDSGVKNKFKLGTIVEIGIGYGSEFQKVLKGFVALQSAQFDGSPSLTVTIMDVRRLMMSSGARHMHHEETRYSDIVKKILKNYSKLCKAEVETTSEKLEDFVAQEGTDYQFIAGTLLKERRIGKEFLVLGDTAYFRTPRKVTQPIMKLEYGRELTSFQVECAYLDMKLEVSGYDQDKQSRISASASARSGESQSTLFSKTPVSYIVDQTADTQAKARMMAESMTGEYKAGAQQARGNCIGLPEIVPGRFIEVVKLEKMANRKYYITSVTHSWNERSFTTSFEAGGWK